MTLTTGIWPRPLVWLAGLVLCIYVAAWSARTTTHGFVAYYAASQQLVAGQLGARIYDDGWFTRYVQQLTGTDVREIFGPNTPAMAMLALPVAPFSPPAARVLWLIASLCALFAASIALVAADQKFKTAAFSIFIILLLLSPPVFANLRTGQAYLFVFAAFAGCAFCLLRGRDVSAGVWLGLLMIIKSTGFPLLALLAIRGRRRSVAAAAIVAVAVAFATMVWSGPGAWLRYPSYVLEFIARPSASVTAYQTTAGLVRHLCVGDPVWNPAPVGDCGGLAPALPIVVMVLALGMTVAASRGADAPLWLAAGVSLSVLAAPIAEEHHFVTLGVAMMLLLRSRSANEGNRPLLRWWPWAVYAVLLMVPLSFTAQRWTRGWASLAAYPRLYAGWWLWALAIVEMRRSAKIGSPTAL